MFCCAKRQLLFDGITESAEHCHHHCQSYRSCLVDATLASCFKTLGNFPKTQYIYTNIKVHNIYPVGHGSTGHTERERNEDYTWVVLARLQRKDFATALSANIVFTKSVKWSDTDAVRLCSATNCQNNTSAFVTAADVCGFTPKNYVVGLYIFDLASFYWCHNLYVSRTY